MLVDIADWNEIDAWRADIEVVHNFEIDPDLLNLGGAMQFVVCIEASASVFKLDLCVEDDIGRKLIGGQQHNPGSVEAVLPLAVCRRILHITVFYLAICSKTETRRRRFERVQDGAPCYARECQLRGGAEQIPWGRRTEAGPEDSVAFVHQGPELDDFGVFFTALGVAGWLAPGDFSAAASF